MLALIVEFRIKQDHIGAFDSALAQNARLSRETEPGCKQFDVCRDSAEPALFYLYELYDNEAAIQAHLASAHYTSMNSQTVDWVASKSVRKLVRTSP